MNIIYIAVLFLLGCTTAVSRRIHDRIDEDSINFGNTDDLEQRESERHQVGANYESDDEIPISPFRQFRRPDALNREEPDDSDSESGHIPTHYAHRSYSHRPRRFKQDIYDSSANHRRSDYFMKADNNDVLYKIYDSLQDISKYLREQHRYGHAPLHHGPPPPPHGPPPPSQIIYVPYPIYTPTSCSCGASTSNNSNDLSIGNRFNYPEDMRQVWGLSNAADPDNENYKPISFNPSPKSPTSNNLAHESSSSANEAASSQLGRDTPLVNSPPSSCDIALLSCCRESTKEALLSCLESHNCNTNVDCSNKHINDIILKAERFFIKN